MFIAHASWEHRNYRYIHREHRLMPSETVVESRNHCILPFFKRKWVHLDWERVVLKRPLSKASCQQCLSDQMLTFDCERNHFSSTAQRVKAPPCVERTSIKPVGNSPFRLQLQASRSNSRGASRSPSGQLPAPEVPSIGIQMTTEVKNGMSGRRSYGSLGRTFVPVGHSL